ncbi:unnamed protein product [Cochlearia groenlandica]
MDLEDWELLPRNSNKNNNKSLDLYEYHETEKKKMIRESFDMDYFICPTQVPVGKTEIHQISNVVVPTQLPHIPITWEPITTAEEDTYHNKNNVLSPRIRKETEFADMKIDTQAFTKSPMPSNDEKHSESKGRLGVDGDLKCKKEIDWDDDEEEEEEEERICGERMNLWKFGLNGIGAICSFGVAAATICVFLLGHNNNNIKGCRNKNKILRFQIYSDDNKRKKEVVKHGSKLNEAISVMKSLPVTRAQISFGGYYDRSSLI